jgi:predicted lysophospholipase L1 biosynthesis ABC-type transport system permease subunit
LDWEKMMSEKNLQEDVRELADRVAKIAEDYAWSFRVYTFVATILILGLLVLLVRLTEEPVVQAVCYGMLAVACIGAYLSLRRTWRKGSPRG